MYLKSLYPDIPEFPPTNIHDVCLSRRPVDAPDFCFQIDGATGQTRSWNEVKARVAHAMTALGAPESKGGLDLRPENGEIVGVLSPNSLEYTTILWALFGLTVPVCPLSSYSTVSELSNLLSVSTATRLFVHPNLLPIALEAASNAGLPHEHVYVLGGQVAGRKSLGDMIDEIIERKTPVVPVKPVKHNTLAYLLFSSGTSGVPKSVMVSHSNLVFQMYQNDMVEETLASASPPLTADAPVPAILGFLPLHHTFGIGVIVCRSTRVPTTVVIMPTWSVDLALDLIAKYKISYVPLIPSVIIQIIEAQQKRKTDISSIMRVVSAAAYLPEEIRLKFSSLLNAEVPVAQGWGMSECTLTGLTTVPDGIIPGTKTHPNSIGILWPSTEAKIMREDGTHAEVGEPGELLVRGRYIALGYWRNEKATRETFLPDGWLRTGDLVKADEWGNFFFVDRNKDILKISGMQVAPSEIEDTLLAEPSKLIDDVAVVGISGGRTADERVPRAWIVLSDAGKRRGAGETVRILDAYVRKTLSKYKHLRGGIEVIHELPKSPTGKVLRRNLAEQYEARQKVKAKL